MALIIKQKNSDEIPKDAIRLTEDQALHYQMKIIDGWHNSCCRTYRPARDAPAPQACPGRLATAQNVPEQRRLAAGARRRRRPQIS